MRISLSIRGLVFALALGLCVSCAGSGVIVGSLLVSLARSLLDAVAHNYDESYSNEVMALLVALNTVHRSSEGTVGVRLRGESEVSEPLELEVALLRETVVSGNFVPVSIADGDVLRDGRGDPNQGDNLKISFRTSRKAYVYVIAIDGSGWVQPIFPNQDRRWVNPVAKETTRFLPEGREWFYLDEYRGVETFYFLASEERREDVEEIMMRFASKRRSDFAVGGAAALQAVEEPAVLERGLGGKREGSTDVVSNREGEPSPFRAVALFAELQGGGLTATRWFRHE